jgi:ABC-type sugar transport system permease subunit
MAANRRLLPYLLLLPAAVLLIGLYGAPFVSLFYYAVRDVPLAGPASYVGLDNLRQLLGEQHFRDNLLVTVAYAVGVLTLSLPIAYVAALLVTSSIRAVGVIRTLLLVPWVLAPVVTALLFRTLVDPSEGPIAAISGINVVADSNGALLLIIVHSAWRSIPLEMLLLAAAMSVIPRELYEAVKADGAGAWQEFRHITLPLTRTALLSAVIMITVFTLHDAESIFALTRGGPGYATESIAVRLFKEAFLYYNVGGGAAIGVVLVLLTIAVLFGLSRLSRRSEVHQ